MNLVHCPRCSTEHRIAPGSTGYTCAGCGTAWRFVRCGECGATFHAAAGTEAWTCKRCGRRNVAPLEAGERAGAEASRPRRQPTGWSRLSPRGKLAVVAVPVAIVVAVLIAVFAFGDNGGNGGGKPVNHALVLAHRTYCNDLSVLQNGFRTGALQRFLNKMTRDIVLYRQAGDRASVKDLMEIQGAAAKLKTALEKNSSGVQPANSKLEKAISVGPTC